MATHHLPVGAVGLPCPLLRVPSSVLQDGTKTAGFALQHLPLFHAAAPCWISPLGISCFIAFPPGTLAVRDDKVRVSLQRWENLR